MQPYIGRETELVRLKELGNSRHADLVVINLERGQISKSVISA
jgi:hypothetical protein